MAPGGLHRRRAARVAASPDERADAAAARAAAITLLARRDFAGSELQQRLRDRGFEPQVVSEVVDALTAGGTIDDRRFAHNYVSWHAGRGQGPIRIATELRARGVAEALIDSALAEGHDWQALAQRARRARFGPQPPRGWPDQARQGRFLQYRGFSADHVRSATGADPEREEPA